MKLELETRIVQRGETSVTTIEKYIIKGIPRELRDGMGLPDPQRDEVEAADLATLSAYLGKAHPPSGKFMRKRITLEPTATGGDLSWGRIVQVMDACYKGGFTDVSLP